MQYRLYHKVTALIVSALFLFQSYAWAASIENIRYKITPDEKVLIYYDIPAKGSYSISVHVSLDGGKNFPIKPLALSGDVGKGVKAGASKEIEWDAFQDMKMLTGDMVVMIESRREADKPINKWLVLAGLLVTGGTIAAVTGAGSNKPSGQSLPKIEYGQIMIKVTFPE